MAARDRFRSLEQLAGFTEAAASRQLAERLRALDTEQDRLRQLERYLTDYLLVADSRATTVAALGARQQFVARLQAAVRQQADVSRRAREQLDQAMAAWRGARSRKLALAQLRERAEARRRDLADRREQRRQDELGTQRHGLRTDPVES